MVEMMVKKKGKKIVEEMDEKQMAMQKRAKKK